MVSIFFQIHQNKIDKSTIIKYLKKCVGSDNVELECIFDQNFITKDVFLKVIDNLKEISSEMTETNSLDDFVVGKENPENCLIFVSRLMDYKI